MNRLLIAAFGMMIGLCGAAGGRAQPTGAVSLLAKVDHLGLELPVKKGQTPALIATITSPRVRVELR